MTYVAASAGLLLFRLTIQVVSDIKLPATEVCTDELLQALQGQLTEFHHGHVVVGLEQIVLQERGATAAVGFVHAGLRGSDYGLLPSSAVIATSIMLVWELLGKVCEHRMMIAMVLCLNGSWPALIRTPLRVETLQDNGPRCGI